jgi:hypothetical protein
MAHARARQAQQVAQLAVSAREAFVKARGKADDVLAEAAAAEEVRRGLAAVVDALRAFLVSGRSAMLFRFWGLASLVSGPTAMTGSWSPTIPTRCALESIGIWKGGD